MFSCCLPKRKKRTKGSRRKRRGLSKSHTAVSRVSKDPQSVRANTESLTLTIPSSAERTLSGDDAFFDCHEELSDPGSSPSSGLHTSPTHHHADDGKEGDMHQVSLRAHGVLRSYHSECYTDASSGAELDEDEDEDEDGALASCLGILDRPHSRRGDSLRHLDPSQLVPAGSSLPRRDVSVDPRSARECWDECEAASFSVRGPEYIRTKQKQPSAKPFYRLVAVDMFSFPSKACHIARHMALPPIPHHPTATSLPPMLIVNLQLPTYPPPFFGNMDGPGHSIIFYYVLREDFDPAAVENPTALYMLQRFFDNGREADGTPTRERLKLIPKVSNPDEWAVDAPLSRTEHNLLRSYNEKPVMTRPQHLFFPGPGYIEVDLDIHSYAFLARKALGSFMSRIREAVWDVGLVVQGNTPDELPEQVMACGRMFRVDFEALRPFEAFLEKAATSAAAAAKAQAAAGGAPAATAEAAEGDAAVAAAEAAAGDARQPAEREAVGAGGKEAAVAAVESRPAQVL